MGPYQILRLINRGGQGSVYLGYDKRLQRRVAIKIYQLPGERIARKRLLCEAQLVASIQSPKVVQIHDVIESPEHLAMVMEYVPGCDLEELLGAVRLSLGSILTIAADVAGALTAARQQRVVHGDLKARNVLISATGRAKLTDFGIAQRRSFGGASAASRSSMSPEQYLGKTIDERSDLFALGSLLYRMLAGTPPFCHDGRLDGRALVECEPVPLQALVCAELELPRELADLVTALLQKAPADRPANTRIVRQVLRRVASGLLLAASNSLLEEARPCFRPESAQDIPPPVPADLGSDGRSRLPVTGKRKTGPWRLPYPAAWLRIAAVTCLAVVGGLVYQLALPQAETRVFIEAPVMRLAANTELPGEISSRWLVEEVSQAMRDRLGPLQVTGPIGATPVTTLYADPALREEQEPQERVQLGLRCIDLLCVFAVTRSVAGRQANQQAVLFPDMSAQQWRDIVRTTTRALYP